MALATILMAADDPITKGDVGMFVVIVVGGIIALAVIGYILTRISDAYRH